MSGEGHNTRLLAKCGASVTALDISEVFIQHARQLEEMEPLGTDYLVAGAVDLPFAAAAFDFATGFMSFMLEQMTKRGPFTALLRACRLSIAHSR
jgi:ubiquinone/menaquinone biosynthesis C-methylase UbiE